MTRKSNWTPLTKLEVVEKIKEMVNKCEPKEPYITHTIFRIRSVIERWEYQQLYMKEQE
jgi:hypothetical protein